MGGYGDTTIPISASTKTITVSRQDMEKEHPFLVQSFFTVPLSITPNVRYNGTDYGDGLYVFEIQFEPQTPGNPYTLSAFKTALVEDGMIFWGNRFDAKMDYELQRAYPNPLTRPKKSSDDYKKLIKSINEKIRNRYVKPLRDKRSQILPKSSKIRQNDILSITVNWTDINGNSYPMDGAEYLISSPGTAGITDLFL